MIVRSKNMSQKRYFKVRDFDKLQHYRDRKPLWIKLDCAILDDYDFSALPDESKFHAVGLMILAARLNNKFPDDEQWLRKRISANSKINLKLLLEIGFLEVIKGARTGAENSFNARKPNKTEGESASEHCKDLEQNVETEQNRTEENKKEHNTTQQTRAPSDDADGNRNGVLLCGDFNSFRNEAGETKAEEVFNKLVPALTATVQKNRSSFSIAEILKYVESEISNGQNVKNPRGLANSLLKSGSADAFVMQTLYPERQTDVDRKIFGEPFKFSDVPCVVCFGAKLSDTDGKGHRACRHCANERGKSTGLEPEIKGENDE